MDSSSERTDWVWPRFSEPDLIERLLMEPPDFHQLWLDMVTQVPVREFSQEDFEHGSGYPWPRPAGSFVLCEGEPRLLGEIEEGARAELIERFTGPDSGRTPMLAIGSNVAPTSLWTKFGHFEDQADRDLLAITGRLHDFDIGATAELTFYGALPATIFPSPGTAVSAAAIWLTDAQLTQLAWAEIPYWIGRLEARFEFEAAASRVGPGGFDRALVFVNRFGAFAPEGHPIALKAIPAERRTVPAMEQSELLRLVAELTLGDHASAEDLIRAAVEDPTTTGPMVTAMMMANALPFESDAWTPFPRQ